MKSIVAQIDLTHQLINYAIQISVRLSHQITKIMPYNTSYKKSAKLWHLRFVGAVFICHWGEE